MLTDMFFFWFMLMKGFADEKKHTVISKTNNTFPSKSASYTIFFHKDLMLSNPLDFQECLTIIFYRKDYKSNISVNFYFTWDFGIKCGVEKRSTKYS